jgi:MFS family permease
LAAYVWHGRRTPNPVIDLKLLSIPTFRVGVIGASFFRIGVGAIPFLLPLMLQLSFGLTPFQSGMLTFAAAAGALIMKTTAAPIIRTFGFRRVLIVNALISTGFMAVNGFYTAATPHLLIVAILLVGGFFRSLEFTAVNALSYADIEQANMSRATSFASVAQQVALSLGVAIGALILQTVRGLSGETQLVQSDFAIAFWIVAAIGATSVIWFIRLPIGAGEQLAGLPARMVAASKASAANPRAEATAPQ